MKRTPRFDAERQARIERNSDAFCSMDGGLDDAQMFADLTMQWWLKLNEEKGADRVPCDGIILSERERRIVGLALGEMWERLRALNALMDAA